MRFLTQLITKKTLASILVVFLMVPASLMVLPQKSEASLNALVGAGAGMVGCFIQTGLNNMIQGGVNMLTSAFPVLGMFAGGQALVPIDPIPTEIRECSLDAIVWAFINDLIAGILRDMVVWVEDGFKGTPGFVSNIGGFVLGTAQHTFDRFIDENLAFMCEPFEFNIGLTLTRMEVSTRAERFSCTLDGIIGNVDNFLSGSFADGGWQGFVTVNSTRGGNPLNLLIDANLNILGMQERQLEREFDLLAWGRGFFSVPDEDGNLVTPGVVIEDQLNHALGSPQRRIEMADEVNELIDALIARFITDLFGAGSDVFGGLISSDGSAGWASERAEVYFNIEDRQQALLAEIDELIALAEEAENEEILEAAQQLREDTLALDPESPDTMHLLGGLERTAGYLRTSLAGGEMEEYVPPRLDFTMGRPSGPTGPTTPVDPLAPSNATTTATTGASGDEVEVTWTAPQTQSPAGLAHYAIERCTGATCTDFEQVGTSTTAAFTDTDVDLTNTYRYRITAVDTAGASSPYSQIVTTGTEEEEEENEDEEEEEEEQEDEPAQGTATTPTNATWRDANVTWYTSYPDPGSEECIAYNGCQWAGMFAGVNGQQPESWVQSNNIIAVHENFFQQYRLKTLRLRQGTRTIDAVVYDMCSDSDCDGCCTRNMASTGFLIDLESYTADRFGVRSGVVEWTCLDC